MTFYTSLPEAGADSQKLQTEGPQDTATDDRDYPSESSNDDDSADDIDQDDLASSSNPTNLTKSFNRQRRMNEVASDPNAPKYTFPKSNPQQKPTMNTHARVDDQISSLARHASKLRLDDAQSGMGTKGERKVDKSDRATVEQVLDGRTRLLLLKMINRNVVSEIHGCVSTGKEANVYHAATYPEDEEGNRDGTPLQRAVKVYKTSILVFKDRDKYVSGEFRFKQGYNKSNNRAMVKLWAEKELRNLKRVHSAGIPSPEPVYLRQHVMVMEFLGDSNGVAAPRLKDAVIDGPEAEEEWRSLYVQVIAHMRTMYQRCSLVHADLSEYNMLYHSGKIYIIDVSQSVEPDHPRASEFLRMDIKNISDFFRRKGVETLSEPRVFAFIMAKKSSHDDVNAAIENMFAARDKGEDEAAEDVDVAVFRQQYIPRTLEQVYDVERDVEKVRQGEGADLVYRDLLADNAAPRPARTEEDEYGDDDQSSQASGDVSIFGGSEHSQESEEDEVGEPRDPFAPQQPRGKRFEDKDAKKAHKQQVKDQKHDQRSKKMPKHVKKKLMNRSKR